MKVFLLLYFLVFSSVVSAKTYYVAPTGGSDSYPGTKAQPWATWQKAFTGRVAGDTVYFRGGVWSPLNEAVTCIGVYINGLTGTHDHPICFFAYPPDFDAGNKPVLDFSNTTSTCYTCSGMEIQSSTYVKLKGLTVKNRKQNSSTRIVYAINAGNEGTPNGNLYFDQVTSSGHGGPGFYINYYDSLYLINCDSRNNCDSLDMGGHLGGFGNGYSISAKGNPTDLYRYTYIKGCRAWKNSADGFAVSTTKQFYLYNNWAFSQGKLDGDGDGFKFMFSYETDPGKRMICNNIAANCLHESFSENNLTDVTYGPFASYYNNSVYNCESGFESVPEDWNGVLGSDIYKNNMAYHNFGTAGYDQAGLLAKQYLFPAYCTFSNNTWIPNVNFPFWIYNPAVKVTDADFVSLDVTELQRPRKADGSLPDVNFLKLAAGSDLIDAGVNVGLPFIGSAPDIGAFEYGTLISKPVTSITVSGAGGLSSITTLNGTLQLSATILPADAANKTVTWSITSGTDKASISSTGLVTALSNGTAVARAIANDGSGIYGTLTITISNQAIPVTSITVTGAGGATTINAISATLQLSATILPANATNKTVTWSITSGTDKASINSTGLVTALNIGTVVARATASDGSGIYGSLTITISNQAILVTSISVTGAGGATTISTLSGTLQLSAAILPANATNKTVTWSITSGTDKASVSSTGLVAALNNGTAVARATANDGSAIYGTITITISNQAVPVTSISVTGAGGATIISSINGTLQLSAAILPVNATNKSVSWSITNGTGRASISSAGLITALNNGTVSARATANDGSGVYGTLTITISNQAILVTSISVAGAGGATTISADNGTLQLSASIWPLDATDKTVTWSITSGIGKASISSTGLITALDNGTAVFRATANDGSGVYGTLTITISNQIISVTNISVTGAGGTTLITSLGSTLQLSASVLPSNATNKTVTWSISSGTDKASISSTGLITALSYGTAVAMATANDRSGIYGSVTITISNQIIPVTSISVSGAGGATTIGTDNGILQLNATVLPTNATNKTVTWSITSGTDKASISSTGLITALDNGTAIAMATANDGSGVYSSIIITISNQTIPVTSISVAGAGGVTTINTKNGTIQLSAIVLPANATDKTVTWSIMNGINIASVNSTGLVTAVENGIAVARATANDGSGVYGSLTITISNQSIPVSSISVSGQGGATSISKDKGTLQLSAKVLPDDATNMMVTWSISSGIDKASISSTGLISAIDNGTITAMAIANDGSGIYGTINITISSIPISPSAAHENLHAKIYPNPAREMIKIQINESSTMPDFIQIVDLSGIVVLRSKLDPGVREFTIPVDLKNGLYIIQLGNGIITKFSQKLIISR